MTAAFYIKKSCRYIVGNGMTFDFHKHVLAKIKETSLSSISNFMYRMFYLASCKSRTQCRMTLKFCTREANWLLTKTMPVFFFFFFLLFNFWITKCSFGDFGTKKIKPIPFYQLSQIMNGRKKKEFSPRQTSSDPRFWVALSFIQIRIITTKTVWYATRN